MNKFKSKLYLKDFPDKTYLLLKEPFNRMLFKNFLKYFLSYNSAGRFLKTDGRNISKWKRKKHAVPLFIVIKILNFLNKKGNKIPIRDIEKNLIAYKHYQGKLILDPKFPINFNSKEGAILAAALLCDGGINKNGYPVYNNSEKCMREKVVNAINNLIGNIQVDPLKPYENNCLYFPKILKNIVVTGLHMQIGDKVLNNPRIPEVFLNTNKKEVIGEFLNQAFSDDGTAYTSKSYNQGCIAYGESVDASKYNKKFRKKIKREKLTKYASNLVKDCKILLEKLGIKVNGPYLKQEYIRKKGSKRRIIQSWGIQIQGRINIEKYQKLVGFSIERKNEKVKEILDNYKEVDYGTSFRDAWQKVLELEKENKKIIPRTFMKKRGCTLEYARFLLKWLRKERIIKISGGGQNKGIWGCTPYEYRVTNPIVI